MKNILAILICLFVSAGIPTFAANMPVPPGVEIRRDIAYGADPLQKFDVYLPAKHGDKMPVIFMVHGGGWMGGDKWSNGVVQYKVAQWVPKGYVFISANYRLVPKVTVEDQTEDIASAVAYAQTNAAKWGGDKNKFILMGHSAGAHLIATLAVDPALQMNLYVEPLLGAISLDTAALDVPDRMNTAHADFFDKAFGSDANYWTKISPMHRLKQKPAPMLFVCSSSRAENSCAQANAFAEKVKSLGGRAQVLPEMLNHDEINKMLGQPGSYTQAVDKFISSLLTMTPTNVSAKTDEEPAAALPALRDSLPVPVVTEPAPAALDRTAGQEWHRTSMNLIGSMCPACLMSLEEKLRKMPGVTFAKVEREKTNADGSKQQKRNASLVMIYNANGVKFDRLIELIKAELYKAADQKDQVL